MLLGQRGMLLDSAPAHHGKRSGVDARGSDGAEAKNARRRGAPGVSGQADNNSQLVIVR
jgi:hypothetical protein